MKRLIALVKKPWLLAGGGVLLIYTLAGFFLIPYLVELYTPLIVAEQIKRQASVKAVHFNPFIFKFDVEDFALKESDGLPIVGLRHLVIDFELESLFHRAWIFHDLILEGLNIHVAMDDQGTLNLTQIADSLPKTEQPPPPAGHPPRFLLKHFALKDGAVEYTRRANTQTLSPLNLELDDISTLPNRNGFLELDALLEGGGALHWDGHFTLEPIRAEGDFRLADFNLASAWKLIHDRLNLANPGGALSLTAHYRFGLQQEKQELNLSKIGCKLTKLHLALADAAEPLLDLDTLQLDKAEFDLGQHSVKLPYNVIKKGQIKVTVDGQGGVNWQNIMISTPQTTHPPPAPPTNAIELATAVGRNKSALAGVSGELTGRMPETVVARPYSGLHPILNSTTLPPAPPAPSGVAATESAPWHVELGALKLEEIGIAYADASSQIPFAATLGSLGLDFAATAEVGADKPQVIAHGIKLTVGDIKIAETGPDAAPEPLFTLRNFQLAGAGFDLNNHIVKLPSSVIEKGLLQVALDEQGGLNWQHLAKPKKPENPTPVSEPVKDTATTVPWRLELGAFKLAELGIRYADASRNRPYVASIGGIGLNFAAKAEVGLNEPKAHLEKLNLSVKDIQLNENGKATPLLGWDSLEVDGGRMDLEKHDLGIDKIALKGGGTQIQRDADGTINLAEIFAPKAGTKAALETPSAILNPPSTPDAVELRRHSVVATAVGRNKSAPAGVSGEMTGRMPETVVARPYSGLRPILNSTALPPALPWHVALKAFALQGFKLAYTDSTFSSVIAYDADSIDLNLGNINYPGKNPINVDAKIRIKQGGTLAIKGKAFVSGNSADAKVQVDKLNLAPLQPLVAKFAKLKLDSADFSSNLQVGFRQNDTGPVIKATGTLGVGHLLLKEAIGGQRLLSWKSLAVNGIDFGLKPDRLNIKEVRILEPGVKIAIAKDKSNNFASAFRAQPVSKTEPVKAEEATALNFKSKPQKTTPATSKPFPVKVERVRLDNGIIDFSDISLVIPFSTRVHDFEGTATDITTTPNSRSTLKFTGRVEEFGEAKVDGTLIPSAFKTFSDVKVIFRNVEMSSLSPYSATFAGRKITSGKLNLDLLYKIENGQLKSENKIMLDQFTLGEKVESPGATSLPLDLAIALLKDGDGKINATVPIEGDVDKPTFAYGPLLWEAFVNLVKTAVTAPFRAIGPLLGIAASEDLGSVLFPPGTDALPPPEREKIQHVAKAVAQRPTVKLTLKGGFDTKLDGEAMRSLRIRQAVAQKLGNDGGDGTEPLSFSDVKTQKALEDLADKRGGANFLDDVQAEFEKSAGHKPTRVQGVSALLGRASEDANFYEKAYQKLVESEPLPDSALEALADQRMKVVLKELASQPGYDPVRVVAGKAESVSDGKDGNVPTKMELGAQE